MNALDGSNNAAGAFCDLSKVFDSVNFEVMIAKLKHYEVVGTAINWLLSFLEEDSK